jgi:hypothetical protein
MTNGLVRLVFVSVIVIFWPVTLALLKGPFSKFSAPAIVCAALLLAGLRT